MDGPKIYLLFDKISPRLRILVSVILIAAGFLIQVSTRHILAGMPFVILCALLNVVKSVSVKKPMPDKTEWQQVTPKKIDEVLEHCRKIKKFRSGNLGCLIGFVIFLVFAGGFLFPVIQELSVPFPLVATVVNACVLFIGLGLSGRRTAWMPRALDTKVAIVKGIIDSPLVKNDPSVQGIPYLEMGHAQQGIFPNDTRILIKFKDGPEDFIGVQGQISINSVKSRNYPYFYVVLIARPGFGLFEKFAALKVALNNVTIEKKKTKEVDVIVVRQTTTKTSGYHTDGKMQNYILTSSVKAAKRLLSTSNI
ncbi:MAG: hypothetical protein JSV98_10525 [candidate division WOR-3 bacterium]|nr:MAG: hypothetical protein JSV98_10525 [candidate division WOR-3 bacterium]